MTKHASQYYCISGMFIESISLYGRYFENINPLTISISNKHNDNVNYTAVPILSRLDQPCLALSYW